MTSTEIINLRNAVTVDVYWNIIFGVFCYCNYFMKIYCTPVAHGKIQRNIDLEYEFHWVCTPCYLFFALPVYYLSDIFTMCFVSFQLKLPFG